VRLNPLARLVLRAANMSDLPRTDDHAVDYTTDAALLEGLLRGDARAWRAFRRYEGLLRRCISKVTSRFSAMTEDDNAEIYAALLLQLVSGDMGKLRSYDPARGAKLTSWLGMLASNAAYDHLRRRRNEPTKTTDDIVLEQPSDGPSADELLERHRQSAQVARSLEAFSERDREFVELYFQEQLPPEAVAEQMQISVKTVYTKKHKIQARLATLLANAA
jgi:RNA polymerase sigma-70 factor (ECF subfamily)